ncbi:MAG: ATP-binding protein, partial [Caldimicrobium sp.]
MNLYRKIKKLIGKAIFGYNLVEEGDKLLIALSGGEDSLVLTHFLSEWRHLYHRELHLYAIHLDMGFIKEEKSYAEGVNYLKTFCEE